VKIVARTVTTVDELKELVGQELGTGAWLEISQERVNAFAEVTGDHQWIHVDPERAAASPLGCTIAHGFLTLALLPLLRRDWQGISVDLPRKMGINYGLNRVRFITPVKVGKRIRLRSKLLSVEQVAPQIVQTIFLQTIEIEGEERPAMVAESISRAYL
jgi:acyl dehydratase